MKFKTIASTLCMSALLLVGTSTQVEALTLPEPTTHSFTFSAGGNTGEGEYLQSDAVNVTVTLNGYYGTLPTENFGHRQWDDEISDNIFVIAEGSSVVLSLSSDYPEMIVNDYLDPDFDTTPYWDYVNSNLSDGTVPSVGHLCGGYFVYPNDIYYGLDFFHATWCFQEEGSNVINSYIVGFPLTGLLYTLEKTGANEYTYNPTVNSNKLTFVNFNHEMEKAYCYFSLGNFLVINQEGVDELEETGKTSFCTLTKDANYSDFEDVYFYNYPGLLELLGGESSEPTTPSTPESTSPTYASWAEPQVTFAEENNLIVDSLGNDYTKSITRTQIADLLVNMIEQHTGIIMAEASADTFTDSTSEAVLKAFDAGIISGKGEGIFDPEATATRQEIAIMIVNAIKVLEENTGESFVAHNLTSLDGYADFDTTADWAQNHVAILANNGIMSGSDGYLTPLSDTSIQECLVLNNNLFKLGE